MTQKKTPVTGRYANCKYICPVNSLCDATCSHAGNHNIGQFGYEDVECQCMPCHNEYRPKEYDPIYCVPVEVDSDPIKQPSHYKWIPGIECKDICEHFNFYMGNAIKYIYRADHKENPIQDLKKAMRNLEYEIERREAHNG